MDFKSTETKIDRMGGPWSHYKNDSIGRAIHYIYHICTLTIAETVTFQGGGIVNLGHEKFTTIEWSKGYPHFNFVDIYYNKIQNKLLKED